MNIKTHIATGELGQHIQRAASDAVSRFALKRKRIARYDGRRALLRHAFALEFNQVMLSIHPSDSADDVVARFHAALEAQHKAYANSPKGIAAASEKERRLQRAQADTTEMEGQLAATLGGPLPDIVEWVMRFVVAAGWNGIEYDAAKVEALFKDAGFKANDFVGDEFMEELQSSADAMGRYIIGQFLDLLPRKCGFPDHHFERFVGEYREMVAEA